MVAFDDVHQLRAMNIIILQFSTFRPKTCSIIVFTCKIKIRLERIVKENTVRITSSHTEIERESHIQWIMFERLKISIRIPVLNTSPAQVEVGGLISATEKDFVVEGFFRTIHIISSKIRIFFPVHWRIIRIKDFSLFVLKRYQKIFFRNPTYYGSGR